MSAQIAQVISKKLIGKQLGQIGKKDDPYYDHVKTTGCCGLRKKTKLVVKKAPIGATESEAAVLKRVKKKARHLDQGLANIGGVRIGWGAVIGLVPEVGTAIAAYLAYEVYKEAATIDGGLPSDVKAAMAGNIGRDIVLGIIPFVGDLMDAFYKCNTRNAIILENEIKRRINERRDAQGLPPLYNPKDHWKEIPSANGSRHDNMAQREDLAPRIVPRGKAQPAQKDRRDDPRVPGNDMAPALPARRRY